ncbi:phytoene/squalene synthase family protein [Phycisphaerales bacterium AB-hyl4]|uniref:Phytoene/squalene synthase family protein n=1 Tax=Natronomicrosphaera hydrolytica TaxID=3242702 RepID=A0ABV4U4E1_9BACT
MTVGHNQPQPAPPPIDSLPEPVRQSFEHCHRVTREHGRNFYHGLKLTPEPKRSAMYAMYAFMRACDDLADDAPGCPPAASPSRSEAQRSSGSTLDHIETHRRTMQQVINAEPGAPLPPGPVWPAFHHVIHHYPIDPAHLHAMLDGQRCDATQNRYATFDDLYQYCYKVASVVGFVCLAVWGHDHQPQTMKLAEYRGIAFQLTNILRDLAEDASRGRIYLPADELERFGYSPDALLAGVADVHFDRLMTYQIERAQSYYEMAATLERHIAPDCQPTSWAMCRIYEGLLERIAQNPRRVLSERVRLSGFEKLRIALTAAWRSRRARQHSLADTPAP